MKNTRSVGAARPFYSRAMIVLLKIEYVTCRVVSRDERMLIHSSCKYVDLHVWLAVRYESNIVTGTFRYY